jgi:sugar phosphate isomerase/epimerase
MNDNSKVKNYQFKFSVTISNEISATAPFLLGGDPVENIAKAKRMGYDAVELHFDSPSEIAIGKLAGACEKYHIQVSGIATGSIFVAHKLSLIDDSDQIREAAIRSIKEYVDLAQAVNSLVIIGCVRGNLPNGVGRYIYETRLTGSLEQIADYASKRNVSLVLEAINRYENNYLNTAAEVAYYIKSSKIPNLKILMDTFHMNIEEKGIIKTIAENKELLGYIHFADSNRQYPGAGNMDFANIVTMLKAIGYNGYVSFECLPLPSGDEAAKAAINHIRAML